MDAHSLNPMQDDLQLVSTPPQFTNLSRMANSPFSNESNVNVGEERLPQSFPSPEQEVALNVLKDVEEDTVLDWLRLLRSIEPSCQFRPSHGGLTVEQFNALHSLKECENGHVLAGLRHTLLGGIQYSYKPLGYQTLMTPTENVLLGRTFGGGRSTSKRSTTSSRSTRKSSARSSLRSSLGLSDISSPLGNSTCHSSPRSSLGQGTLSRHEEVEHTHWCTYGEHPDPLTTCDGWKRHEKEHEIVYVCMPDGLVENNGSGPCCALCGVFDPSPAHLDAHQASTCTEGAKVTRTRKSNLAKHLMSSHRILHDDAIERAQMWRCKPDKKAFACGFCISFFPSLTDRLNHIDHEHWSQGENMKSWSLTTLIKGLLLQPGVSDAWQYLLANSEPSLPESSFTWELPTAEGLQLRLELCDEAPQQLASAAFELGISLLKVPSDDYAAPVGQSERQQLDVDFSDNRTVTSAPPTSRIASPSHATFSQRAALAAGRPTISPLNNMNTSQMELCRPQSAQQNRQHSSTNPDANGSFPDWLTSSQGVSFDGVDDTIQHPWSHLTPSTRSLPLNSDIQYPHSPSLQDHLDLNGTSFFNDSMDTALDQEYHPSFTNSVNSGLNHHDTPPDYFHPSYNTPLPTASFDDRYPGAQRHLRYPSASSNGSKPLPALPAQPEEPGFDSNYI